MKTPDVAETEDIYGRLGLMSAGCGGGLRQWLRQSPLSGKPEADWISKEDVRVQR